MSSVELLTGPRTDAFRIRQVVDSAFLHVEESQLRARRNASSDPMFAEINREIGLAMEHLKRARTLAETKRASLPPTRYDQ